MSLKFKQMRSASGYRPGKTPVEYEKPQLHHFGTMPMYETHKRLVRAWDPKRKEITTREVEKIIMAADGRTPRSPKLQLVKIEVPGKPEGRQIHEPVTTLIPVLAPVRLKKGTPKAIYRLLKKLERNVGLDKVYAGMQKEAV